jgi:putative ABC transport system substrate-binding protein
MTFIKTCISAILFASSTLVLVTVIGIGLFVIQQAQPKPQQYDPVKIGLLQYIVFLSPIIDGFKEGMAELGYVEGRDIVYTEKELALEFTQMQSATQRIIQQNPDLIFAVSSVAARAALQETSNSGRTDIPVVFSHAFNAVEGDGAFVASYRSSGNNATGIEVSFEELTAKKLDFLERINRVERLVVFEPLHPDAIDFPTPAVLAELKDKALGFGTELVILPIESAPGEAGDAEIQQLLDSLQPGDVDAYFHVPSHITDTPENVNRVLAMVERLQIPSAWTNQVQVRDLGGLLTVEEDLHAMGKQNAFMADKILRGIAPQNIPIEFGRSQNLYINTATAQKFGITIPADILQIANTVD